MCKYLIFIDLGCLNGYEQKNAINVKGNLSQNTGSEKVNRVINAILVAVILMVESSQSLMKFGRNMLLENKVMIYKLLPYLIIVRTYSGNSLMIPGLPSTAT